MAKIGAVEWTRQGGGRGYDEDRPASSTTTAAVAAAEATAATAKYA